MCVGVCRGKGGGGVRVVGVLLRGCLSPCVGAFGGCVCVDMWIRGWMGECVCGM